MLAARFAGKRPCHNFCQYFANIFSKLCYLHKAQGLKVWAFKVWGLGCRLAVRFAGKKPCQRSRANQPTCTCMGQIIRTLLSTGALSFPSPDLGKTWTTNFRKQARNGGRGWYARFFMPRGFGRLVPGLRENKKIIGRGFIFFPTLAKFTFLVQVFSPTLVFATLEREGRREKEGQ